MSYEIVKAIKIDYKTNTVKIKSSSNNCYPKTFTWWDSNSLSKILAEDGKIAVIKEILIQYFNGNFQKTNNNFEKSLVLLDYNKYNWDTVGYIDDKRPFTYEELANVLYENLMAYNTRYKGKFIIENNNGNLVRKLPRGNSTRYLITSFADNAKVFTSHEEAKFFANKFLQNSKIIELVSA